MYYYLLYSILALLILALIRGLYEPYTLDATHSVLGQGDRALRVLLLTDIHARFFFVKIDKIYDLIRNSKIDVIILAGDLSDDIHDFESGLEIIRGIKALADQEGIPFWAVRGNHDPQDYGSRLMEMGVRYLENDGFLFQDKNGLTWEVIGLDDLRVGQISYSQAQAKLQADIDKVLSGKNDPMDINCGRAQIILAHNPYSIFNVLDCLNEDKNPEVPEKKFPARTANTEENKPPKNIFLLSGHFHGGQIWMPFHLEYRVLRQERMAKDGYRKGPYERDGIKGYISRGLGCVIVPIRFFSRPEAAIIELRF